MFTRFAIPAAIAIAIALAIALATAVSHTLALLGEPQSLWLWRDLLGAL